MLPPKRELSNISGHIECDQTSNLLRPESMETINWKTYLQLVGLDKKLIIWCDHLNKTPFVAPPRGSFIFQCFKRQFNIFFWNFDFSQELLVSFYLQIQSSNPLGKIGVWMKVQLIHSFLNFAQNISECLTVIGTSFQGTHFNVNLLYTAQQVINLQHINTGV